MRVSFESICLFRMTSLPQDNWKKSGLLLKSGTSSNWELKDFNFSFFLSYSVGISSTDFFLSDNPISSSHLLELLYLGWQVLHDKLALTFG